MHIIQASARVFDEGGANQDALKDISKKIQQGWENVHIKISTVVLNKFLDRHKDLNLTPCYLYKDVGSSLQ